MNTDKVLKAEEYVEPDCLLCDKPVGTKQKIKRIPQQRISAKLDELMSKGSYANAENLLKYWVAEARANGDNQGEFMVYNEMMGFYRKTGKQEEGYWAIDKAISMLDSLQYENTISGAKCYINARTVYTTFKQWDKALELFDKAAVFFKNNPDGNEFAQAGLYNNMALAYVGKGSYDEAYKLYDNALKLLEKADNSKLEMATTYLNKADALIAEKGINENTENTIVELMYNAQLCLDDEEVERDAYYAYVADKCYPIYEYFEWYQYADELKERIKSINERA